MKNIKKFKEYLREGFMLSSEQIPKIGDVVDKIDYKEGDKIAFIDFAGVKNIPVQIVDKEVNITTNESKKYENKKIQRGKRV